VLSKERGSTDCAKCWAPRNLRVFDLSNQIPSPGTFLEWLTIKWCTAHHLHLASASPFCLLVFAMASPAPSSLPPAALEILPDILVR
jgi:hypothetical protein